MLIGFFCLGPCIAWSTDNPVQFDRQIRPILSNKCFPCHGPNEEQREADLRLDLEATAKESVIVPGSAAESELVSRISSSEHDEIMPPPNAKKPLTRNEIELLRLWVKQGAKWTDHWSFRSPQRPPIPKAVASQQARNSIDRFVQYRLTLHNLVQNPAADGFTPSPLGGGTTP